MSSIQETVLEIKNDLGSNVEDRNLYLAKCVAERLSEKSKTYDDDFDKFIESIEKESISEKDFSILSKRIEIFSKTIDKLYKSLITSFGKIDKNL